MYTRTDAKMTDAVTHGIALDSTKGAATAWAYMKYCKVPQQVILRVLAEPKLRRLNELTLPLESSGSNADNNGGEDRHVIHLWRAPAA